VRRRAPRPLGEALSGLLARLAPATTLAAVQEVWEEAVGTVVAAEATPTSEREGVLGVLCTESVWAHELELMGPELVAQINAALGREAITALRCRATPRR
jgi:predicted nucleic acid-binding Zn ribbon protein